MADAAERAWRPGRPVSPGAILAVYRRGAGDPTYRSDVSGSVLRAVRTPVGPAVLHVVPQPSLGQVLGRAWGAGGEWVLAQLPDALGAGDDDADFTAYHPAVEQARRRHPGWRVPRSGLVLDAAVPAVLEQKVTGKQAFASWRHLVRTYGEPAPGPWADAGLLLPPDAAGWRTIPSWGFLRAGVEPRQAATVVWVAAEAERLERAAAAGSPAVATHAVATRLRTLPGVGEWTVAEVAQRALGDADAVSFGDYHVARNIGWALLGRAIDDDALRELLLPYAGHRYRVQRLLELERVRHPRRGPRRTLPTHLPG